MSRGDAAATHVVLTGAPGSGKTTVISALAARGFATVAEAATDVIAAKQAAGVAEPWCDPQFSEWICEVQVQRWNDAERARPGALVIHDRSPVCTVALCRFLGHSVGKVLAAEVSRICSGAVYDRRVFFMTMLDRVELTAARRNWRPCHPRVATMAGQRSHRTSIWPRPELGRWQLVHHQGRPTR